MADPTVDVKQSLFAKLPRTDAIAIANDQHPDHECGIDRRPVRVTLIEREVPCASPKDRCDYGIDASRDLMNDMLAWTCKEVAFEEFTSLVEEGLAFVFDVFGASLTAKDNGGDALSNLRSRFDGPTLLDPTAYFDENATPGAA